MLLSLLSLLVLPSLAIVDTELDDGLMCSACKAVVQVANERLDSTPSLHRRRESDILFLLDDGFCDQKYYRTFAHIPPKMERACEAMLHYSDELEEMLAKRVPVEQAQQFLCYGTVTNYCVVSDGSNPQAASGPRVFVDGEKVETKTGYDEL
jgi:hypothetical protein